ncbi:MAG: dihydroorotate oxidase [Patescibacteria group bacterium]
MSIITSVAGVKLAGCLGNASGPKCTTFNELNKLIEQPNCSIITTKTATLEARLGNPEPRYVDLPLGSINSMGLPNLGYQAYLEILPQLNKAGKCINVSIGGLTLSDSVRIVSAFQEQGVADLIELNLSCPNVPGKPQIGYDFEAVESTLNEVDRLKGPIPLGLKLPPYFDLIHFDHMSKIIKEHNISFITCVNSIGNALVIDPIAESVVIRPKSGFGGLGGDYIKPTALANVHAFYQRLGSSVDIIGVGGVKSGVDVFEFILAGASAVQLGTVLMQQGIEVFQKINLEFELLLKSKNYSRINQFRGKLKHL